MIEMIIVTLVVIWSAVVVFKKVFPKTANSVFLSLSRFCEQKQWYILAKWLKPKSTSSGCGGSCGCEAKPDMKQIKNDEVKPVKWH